MATCGWYGTHTSAVRRYGLGLGATGQAVAGVAAGTCHRGGQGAGQAGATVAWGRALVVAATEAAGAGQVTGGAVPPTAAPPALVPPTSLALAAAQLASAQPGKPVMHYYAPVNAQAEATWSEKLWTSNSCAYRS